MSLWVASYIALWLLTMVMAFAVVVLFRQLGLLHLRFGPRGILPSDDGPSLKTDAPRVSAIDLAGRSHDLVELGVRTTFVFVAPKCSVCELILPGIRSISRRLPKDSRLYVISDGDRQSTEKYAARLKGVTVIASPAVAEAFGVSTTPFGLHVDPSGIVVEKGVLNTLEQIESLVEASNLELDVRSADGAPAVVVGEGVHTQ